MADWDDIEEPTDAFPQIVGGRYGIIRPMGGDHVANNYVATDGKTGEQVTVRMMLGTVAEDETHKKRFVEGGKLMLQITHPHVLAIRDYGDWNGVPYLITEFIDGVTLQTAMSKGFAFSAIEACDIVMDVLTALFQIHRKGGVHRGVHPNGILLDIDGKAMLGDFGVALLDSEKAHDETSPDMFAELGYVADELRGDPSLAGPEADIFAVGALLFAMLTGRSPIDLSLGEARRKAAMEDVPTLLQPIILKATSFQPADRYHSTHEMVLELVPIRDGIARQEGKAVKGNEWLRWFHTLTPAAVPDRQLGPGDASEADDAPKKVIKRRKSQPLATAKRRTSIAERHGTDEAEVAEEEEEEQSLARVFAIVTGVVTLLLLGATAYVMLS